MHATKRLCLWGSHMADMATEVTESAKGFNVWIASHERLRMSHTRTAWSYPPVTSVPSPGPKHTCAYRRADVALCTADADFCRTCSRTSMKMQMQASSYACGVVSCMPTC